MKDILYLVVPCYNEEENVQAMADAIRETFRSELPEYRYEIIFIDNDSSDRPGILSACFAERIEALRQFLMRRISDSLIHRIMPCFRARETAPY